ncbi:MAG: GNAT family N-acetyltransferase [Gammaproteobacteria bacterium]
MQFEAFNDWSALPSGVDALFAQYERRKIFYSRLWFETLTNSALEQDQHMLLACVMEADRALAVLPLVRTGDHGWQSLSNAYSTHFTVLLGDGDQAAALQCLVTGLASLGVQSLRLLPAVGDEPNMAALETALSAKGFDCHRDFRFYNWIERLNGRSFQEYMADRPGQLRNTIARKQRKLAREQGCEIRLITHDGVAKAMDQFKAVNRASWKAGERYQNFIDQLVMVAAEAGWLRMALLDAGGRTIAAQIWFVVHGKASIFRLSFDEDWRPYSPGSILTRFLMEQVIDKDGVDEIDFLLGNERYKQDWMTERRECFGLTCEAPEPDRSSSNWKKLVPAFLKR